MQGGYPGATSPHRTPWRLLLFIRRSLQTGMVVSTDLQAIQTAEVRLNPSQTRHFCSFCVMW